MKKFALIIAMLLFVATGADAQGFLKKIGKAVKDKTTQKTEETVDDAVDKAFDAVGDLLGGKKKDKDKKTKDNDEEDDDEAEVRSKNDPLKADARTSDFVPGEVAIFEDRVVGEQIGEFPSKWDLVRGYAEVERIGGETAIAMNKDDAWISPLMKDGSKNYLGDVFTIEFDMLYDDSAKDGAPSIELDIMHETKPRDHELFTIEFWLGGDEHDFTCNYVLASEDSFDHKEGHSTFRSGTYNDGRWHHYALSFNKRAIKFYVDNKRIINVPNARAGAGWVTLWSKGGSKSLYVKNFRIGKGAVDLYDRNATEKSDIERAIAESGKFVTNNILFVSGKADLKPESFGEINKVAEYMKKNPNARFEVQGHCDNQGSDKVNDQLSQQRAEAVVKALVSLGCDEFNLRAVGKGSHEPVADNSTESGRAKNRRVEFIKK